MKKIIWMTIVFISQLLLIGNAHSIDEKIIWKYGIAIINGEPKYIDADKLDQSEMVISEKYIERYKKEKKDIIRPGRLIWGKGGLITLDSMIDDPYGYISESRSKYHYKVENNKMYLSKDGKIWDELFIGIIEDKPKYGKPRVDVPVFMIIHLKCKWFEGEYELLGTTG